MARSRQASSSPSPPASPGSSGRIATLLQSNAMALRELIDERGTQWVVFAVQPSSLGRATGGTRAEFASGWLCFQSETERRRLPGIPAGWDAMDEGALLALLMDAPVSPSVHRTRRRQLDRDHP